MSVVDIAGRVTHDQTAFDAARWSDHSSLFVDAGADVERFSIELKLGTNWSERYGKSNEMVTIPAKGLSIAPRGSIVVEVAERIVVPYNLYGLVIPTGSLFLDRGIIIAAAKIEPAFRGKLKLRLVNTTNDRVALSTG